jgi:hypothetical protein
LATWAGVVFVAIAMSLTSCAFTSTDTKAWIGKSESELLSSWGGPYSSRKLDDGRVVHTWRTIWGRRDNVRTCLQTFTISAKSEVEGSSSRGCPLLQSIKIFE